MSQQHAESDNRKDSDGFEAEVIARIETMEASEYEFPRPFGRLDYILSISLIIVTAAWTILAFVV